MEKKKLQKLNKAAVATVLAASGITVTAPVVPTKASTIFKDLDPNADYYKPVIELINRGYISGFKDGTFRPNQAITRGESAKMLALALNLNITNPKNPGFRDVPANHEHYKYIAALANEGIIGGYSDKTFRPNESINRNQMAKIIALGYAFQLSNKLTHDFKDVSESNANRFYIQTLYDLGITKGTTGITFSPYGLVTRGQLSTFILRAENTSAEKVKPIKEIGSIEGSYVYINGIKYRVDASLRDIVNDTNAAALKGAHIEGQIVGETLKTISTLTLNAQGKEGRNLTFDGNHSTFSGQLIVQGNYIHFKNWTLTGQVTIAETPRRTLSDFANPWQNKRIASLTGFGFIDWEKPTDTTEEDDDPSYNGGGNDLTEKPSINPGDKVVERMPVKEKHVDFSNCSLRRLVIEANRTYVSSTNKLPHVTVQGWVRQFEMYAHIDTLYIESDVATTMYGVGNIGTIYKNSYKDVYFNSGSQVNLIVVDNSSGWIDLGDHFYVDKIIIPPNKLPNDIFNDFINDNDNIGDLEDSNGDDVDREPEDDVIVPDWEAPKAEIVKIDVQGSAMTGTIKSSEDGYYYYTIRKADERIPTIREIIEEAKTTTLKTSGTGWIDANTNKTITASGLDENKEYVLYLVTQDEADNFSDKVSKSFTTKDGTPPRITNLQASGMKGGTRAKITFKPSETGVYKYMVIKEGDRVPTLKEMLELPENEITVDDLNGVEFIHTGLTADTEYRVYMVMIDESGNQSAYTDAEVSQSNSFWTGPLDNVRPELAKTVLDNSDILNPLSEPTTVILTFNEELDKETAENVKNYTLDGTGNLRGQPYTAKLSSDGKKVTLTIPSMAAFVNNDTLIIRVRNVKDTSGNVILDDGKVNQAIYTYQRDTKPILSNILVNDTVNEAGNMSSNKVTFNANYTGTYYYLIMPANPGENVKKPSVSQVVFPEDNYTDDQVFMGDMDLATGSGEAVEGDGAKLERGNTFNILYDKTKVNHENGYYIYMVLRDRHGNYSNVEVQYFLPNKRDFTLVDFEFAGKPTTGDIVDNPAIFYYEDGYTVDNKNHQFTFNMKFDVEMDPKSFDKSKLKFNLTGDLEKYLEVKNISLDPKDYKKATLVLGYKSTIKEEDIPVAKTKVEYYLTDKQKMQIAIEGLKSWATGKLEEITGEKVTSGTVTVNLQYEDKVKPMLLSEVAYRVNNNFDVTDPNTTPPTVSQIPAKLELTFSEAIDLDKFKADPSVFATLSPNLGSSISIASVAFAKDENNKDIKNKLVLTLNGTFKDLEKLVIKINEPATGASTNKYLTDIANNTILVDPTNVKTYEALYIYRQMPMKVAYANLDGENYTINRRYSASQGRYIYESRGVIVGLTGGYQYDGMKVHYLIANALAPDITAEKIINADDTIADIYGNKSIQKLTESISFEAPFNTNQVFNTDQQYMYIVLTDNYGNISNVVRELIVHPDPNIPMKP